jgi:hypothetical protein
VQQPLPSPVTVLIVVERFLSDPSPTGLADLAAETRRAVQELAAMGTHVAYLGSVALPAEELSFCLFTADAPLAVAELNARVSAPALRTIEALGAPGDLQAGRPVTHLGR